MNIDMKKSIMLLQEESKTVHTNREVWTQKEKT